MLLPLIAGHFPVILPLFLFAQDFFPFLHVVRAISHRERKSDRPSSLRSPHWSLNLPFPSSFSQLLNGESGSLLRLSSPPPTDGTNSFLPSPVRSTRMDGQGRLLAWTHTLKLLFLPPTAAPHLFALPLRGLKEGEGGQNWHLAPNYFYSIHALLSPTPSSLFSSSLNNPACPPPHIPHFPTQAERNSLPSFRPPFILDSDAAARRKGRR